MGAQKSKLGKKDLQELAQKTSCKYPVYIYLCYVKYLGSNLFVKC